MYSSDFSRQLLTAPIFGRVYADVNVHRPRDYWDYETLTVNWGNHEDYRVIRKIGHGKYSNVSNVDDIFSNIRL